MATPTLQTRRFSMRGLLPGDAKALFATLSLPEHCRYLSRGAFADEDELEEWLTDPNWPGRTWIAVGKADGRVAGRFIAVPTKETGIAELGYITVAELQGQGVARECTSALIRHLFDRENHRRLVVEIDADNAASIAVIERLGFTREGHLREHETNHNGLCDLLLYGLLRREWEAARRA